MATVIGQFWGDISGKTAGVVHTRTKSGKMIRARVKPTDAKSAAQVNTRSLFSQSMSMWNTLDSTSRRQWNSFAGTIFRSKTHKKRSVPTGSQAFASSNFALNLANSHQRVVTFSPGTVTGTQTPMPTLISVPPVSKSSCFMTNTAGDHIPLKVSSGGLVLSTQLLTTMFNFPNGVPGAGACFQNSLAGDPFSLSFYLTKSNQAAYTGQVLKGAYLVGNTGVLATITGIAALTDFGIILDVTTDYLDTLKSSFPPGTQAYLHVYAVSQSGQFSKIGVSTCAITT